MQILSTPIQLFPSGVIHAGVSGKGGGPPRPPGGRVLGKGAGPATPPGVGVLDKGGGPPWPLGGGVSGKANGVSLLVDRRDGWKRGELSRALVNELSGVVARAS